MSAKIVVYATQTCGFCFAAKRLLNGKGVAFEEIAVDRRPDLRSWLFEASGQSTVPQIFINGRSIGGFRELSTLEVRGLLDEHLAEPPAVDNPSLRS